MEVLNGSSERIESSSSFRRALEFYRTDQYEQPPFPNTRFPANAIRLIGVEDVPPISSTVSESMALYQEASTTS